MKVGVNLINFGPGVNPESLKRWAQLSESLGYHLLMTSDHIGITPAVQSRYPAPFYEPISLLGWLAGVTSTDQAQPWTPLKTTQDRGQKGPMILSVVSGPPSRRSP